ncbi:uncharacterized protein TNIN_325641 [Trichonephila inaurata madagascariensis]|uniref:LolA-like domain-containing protein n=1 Tax=Trichonephila inaurata madagascariensis TaxID=2747483 RepID=A0A8X6Y3K6_9ARAC|nr:uncharacterized protein TNIN_325641 [Trichonephila inaurata madagascariensis]
MNFSRGQADVKLHEQFINVYSFAVGRADHKLFEPIQGIICDKRQQTLEFPNVNKMQAIAVHSELVLPENLEVRYVDTWLDTKNKIVRVDLERIDDEVPVFEEKSRKYQSEIAIAQMGILYKVTYDKGLFSCKVIPFKDYAYDVQTLFNIKLPMNEWDVGKLFGRNQTTYVYIGKDDIITFRNGEYGLVHAQLKITKSGDQVFYPGLRMIHHFYDVNKKDPAVMHATKFDITRCFGDSDRRDLQFTTIENKALYVKFFLLNPHPDLPNNIKKNQKTAFEAENTLRDNISKDKVFISYLPSKNSTMLKLQVLKHSLKFQLKRDFEQHTTEKPPPTQPTSSSKFPFSLITDDDDKTTRSSTFGPYVTTDSDKTIDPVDPTGPTNWFTDPTTTKKPPKDEVKGANVGHGPGTVAGVSIAMLLVGISIGSAGIFVKMNGLPSCMKT